MTLFGCSWKMISCVDDGVYIWFTVVLQCVRYTPFHSTIVLIFTGLFMKTPHAHFMVLNIDLCGAHWSGLNWHKCCNVAACDHLPLQQARRPSVALLISCRQGFVALQHCCSGKYNLIAHLPCVLTTEDAPDWLRIKALREMSQDCVWFCTILYRSHLVIPGTFSSRLPDPESASHRLQHLTWHVLPVSGPAWGHLLP